MSAAAYIPAALRRRLYAGYAFLGLAVGSVQVGYAAADAGQPTWLNVTLAVYAFVGGAIGYTAHANTPPADATEPEEAP